jgi:hypothetical protein
MEVSVNMSVGVETLVGAWVGGQDVCSFDTLR